MICDLTSRFSAAFGFVPGSALGLVMDTKLASSLGVYVQTEGTFEDVRLYHDKSDYNFANRTLAEDYTNVFATPPMMSFKRQKKLVITTIDNSDIEVVERYCTEPYDINWRGLLIDMVNHQFPADKMEELNNIFEYNGIWNVASEIMNKLKIEAVYIKDVSLEFVEGFEDTISYSFTMRAIKPLEYQLIK
jgi:hypothetical protein